MWFKHRAWIPIAWGLALVNLGAVWFAAQPGEPWHATVHAALAVAFGLGAQRLAARRHAAAVDEDEELRLEADAPERLPQSLGDVPARLQELEERVDFAERLLTKQRDASRREEPPR